MSLLRVLRERRGRFGPTRPPSLWKLIVTLVIVLVLIWVIGRAAGT